MRALLRHRNFRFLWLGQAASTIGDELVTVALALFVVELTGSAADVGFVLAARYGTFVVFLLVGGAFADRLPRQQVMIATDVVRCGLHTLLAALILTGEIAVWQLVAIEAAYGTADAFFRPAYTGLLPQTVPAAELQPATALSSTTMNVAQFAGPALATLLVVTVGAGWAFAFDAATFAVSALLLTLVRPAPRGETPARQPLMREVADGWREVRARAWVWVTICAFSFALLVGFAPLITLGPVVARDLYDDAAVFGVFMAVFGAGTIAGSLVGLRWRPQRPLRTGYLGVAIWPLSVLALALGLPFAAVAALAAAAGAGFALFVIWWDTALATHIPPHLLSRVSAWDWMGSVALLPVGYLLAGPLGEALGPAEVLTAGALLAAVAMAAGALPAETRNLRGAPPSPAPQPARRPIGASVEG